MFETCVHIVQTLIVLSLVITTVVSVNQYEQPYDGFEFSMDD